MAHPANSKPAMVIIMIPPEALDNLKLNFSQPIGTLSAAKFQVTITSPAILSDFHQHRNLHPDLAVEQQDTSYFSVLRGAYTGFLKAFAKDIAVVSNKQIVLGDGTSAYKTDLTWRYRAFKLTTQLVAVFIGMRSH